MFAEVTETQARLTLENAVAEIDRRHSHGLAQKTPGLSGVALRHLLSRDRGARRSPKLEMIPSEAKNLKACTEGDSRLIDTSADLALR